MCYINWLYLLVVLTYLDIESSAQHRYTDISVFCAFRTGIAGDQSWTHESWSIGLLQDFCYRDDPDEFSVIDAINLCITVIAYACDSARSVQMLVHFLLLCRLLISDWYNDLLLKSILRYCIWVTIYYNVVSVPLQINVNHCCWVPR